MEKTSFTSNFKIDSSSHPFTPPSFAQETSDQDLLFAFKTYAAQERSHHIHILILLREIDRRSLHLKRGYSSLYDFLVRGFHYSESAAYRRIQTLQLLNKVPQLEPKIRSGELNLSTAAQIQNHLNKLTEIDVDFIQNQRGYFELILDLVENLKDKSTREVQKILNEKLESRQRQLGILPEFDGKIKMTLQLTASTLQNLDRLKDLLSHVNPNMSYENLIEYLSERMIRKIDLSLNKKRKAAPAPKHQAVDSQAVKTQNGRFIPTKMKRTIWTRDQGSCSYTDSLTGRRCASKHQLQIDHIQPFAIGGGQQEENLRLLCARHNRWRARVTFGKRDYH